MRIILCVVVIGTIVSGEYLEVFDNITSRTFFGSNLNDIRKAPHQVSIQYRGKHSCSGTIISKDWIITAARCVTQPVCCFSIRAKSLYHHEGGTMHLLDRIIVHEHFNINPNGFTLNDIALIHITTPFTMDSSCKSISLGYKVIPWPHALMYGWRDPGNMGSKLKIFKTKIVDKISCNRSFAIYGGIYDNEGCTDGHSGKTGMYLTDAGGPVIQHNLLIGILSSTYGYTNPNLPNIFTEISAYRFWIRRHTAI